jgi:hypothetical protein
MTVWSTFGRRWAALPNASAAGPILKSYFDTLYVALTGDQTVAGVKTFSSNPVVSGGGIVFPGTQVPSAGANTLDDYEEGTWTPAIAFGGGTTGVTYSTQGGLYTKIGRMVTVQGAFVLSSNGTSAGAVTITGLPFTNGGLATTVHFGYYTGMAGLTGALKGYITAGSAVINVVQSAAAAIAAITDANTSDTSTLIFTATFTV